jgi:two-component system phosphate regulon sensor histidine kinase PhoR
MPTQEERIAELTELNEELENYFRNTIIPQLFIDASLRLRKFTPPAMKQFNLKLSDIGKRIIDIYDNFRFSSFLENVQYVIDNKEILEKEIQTSDLRWFQMNILPYIRRKDNTSNGVIVTFVDITYRIKDLKEQEKLISDHETLLDTLSHDIKTPLSSMMLATQQFKALKLGDQEEFETLLNIVDRALNNMQRLILELTEIRKGVHKYQAHEERLDLENIIEDVRLILSDDIHAAGVVIAKDIQVKQVIFTRRKLRSIFYNLINNSIKYRAPGITPKICIKSFLQNDHVVITIKDNGIGIDPSEQVAVFSKYYRIDNSIEGSGIGLYLVKEMLLNAGGKIEVESQPGRGTEMKIYLKNA